MTIATSVLLLAVRQGDADVLTPGIKVLLWLYVSSFAGAYELNALCRGIVGNAICCLQV